MRGFFETQIRFYDKVEEKYVTHTHLVEAFTFTEAEANITKFINDSDGDEKRSFDLKSLKKNSYTDLVYRLGDYEYDWFEAKVSVKWSENDKATPYKYLIAGRNVKDATEQVVKFVKQTEGEPTVISVKIKDLEDLVLKKECEFNGTIIIGFVEQLELEERIEKGEQL